MFRFVIKAFKSFGSSHDQLEVIRSLCHKDLSTIYHIYCDGFWRVLLHHKKKLIRETNYPHVTRVLCGTTRKRTILPNRSILDEPFQTMLIYCIFLFIEEETFLCCDLLPVSFITS